MTEKYVTPEITVVQLATMQMLCQSLQSGTVEDVDRMEFDW